MTTVGLIGTGLIGGSMGYKIKQLTQATLVGYDHNEAHLNTALQLGIIDKKGSLEEMFATDWVILATPVDSVITLLPQLLAHAHEEQIIIDVSSTKKRIAQSVVHHPKRHHFISTHPMWGTEYSGPTAALKNAFEHKIVVICDQDQSDPKKLAQVEHFFASLPMRLVYMNSVEHDLHTAYISHISHITSFALANTVLEKEKDEEKIFQLAGSGFESTVRLAKSSPDMWTPVFEQNADNVLDVLKEHIHQLQLFEHFLETKQFDKIKAYMTQANRIQKIIQ